MIKAFKRWRSAARVRNELCQLSRRELWDIGVSPAEIEKIAWDHACSTHP